MAKTELYAVSEEGRLIYVGDRLAASNIMRHGRSMQPLTKDEAAIYVRLGCHGLARALALNPNGSGA